MAVVPALTTTLIAGHQMIISALAVATTTAAATVLAAAIQVAVIPLAGETPAAVAVRPVAGMVAVEAAAVTDCLT